MSWREERAAARSRQYYKRGLDAESLKRKREDLSWRLRREKREEKNAQRRALPSPSLPPDDSSLQMDQLPLYLTLLRSTDQASQIQALSHLQRVLHAMPTAAGTLIEQGVSRDVINLLRHSDHVPLQASAASLLLSLVDQRADQAQLIVDCGAVPALRAMLAPGPHVPPAMASAVLSLLTSIAESSPVLRDYLLHVQLMPALLPLLRAGPPALVSAGAWCVDALCKGSPSPPTEEILPAVPVLLALLQNPASPRDAQRAASWALAHMSDANSLVVHHLMREASLPALLIPRLSLADPADHRPALRLVGNVAAGEDAHTALLLQHGLLPHLRDLIQQGRDMDVVREAAWTLSNISSGPHAHIQALLDTPHLLEGLLDKARDAPEPVQIEIAWVCTNMASVGTLPQIQQLVGRGALQLMADLLHDSHGHNLALIVVEGIGCVWSAGRHWQERMGLATHPYRAKLEETGALDRIQLLAHSKNPDVSKAIYQLLDEWSGDEEELSEEEFLIPHSLPSHHSRDEYLF